MDVVSYETIRRENIARNLRFLDEIGVTQLPNGAQTSTNFAEPDNVAEPDEMAQPSADQLRVEKETLEARWWARKNTLRTLLALLDVVRPCCHFSRSAAALRGGKIVVAASGHPPASFRKWPAWHRHDSAKAPRLAAGQNKIRMYR